MQFKQNLPMCHSGKCSASRISQGDGRFWTSYVHEKLNVTSQNDGKQRSLVILFAFLLISFIPLFDLLNPGLPITHDGQDHVVRVANFYQNLTEGNIIPRWAPNVNYGYGHPVLSFFYPLPYYLASFLHFLGFNLIDSTKLIFALSYIASGITMYFFVKELIGKKEGFIAALVYIFASYRFVDLYVRGAYGEHVAFVFPPLILYFLLKLSKQYSYWYLVCGSLSVAFLILSHNAISLMFLPIIFLYGLYLIYSSKNRKSYILNLISLVFLGFGMSAFFWIPAFFEAKYTLRDIVATSEYKRHFVTLSQLLYGSWSYGGSGSFTSQIGFVNILGIIASPFVILNCINQKRKESIIIFIFFLYSLIAIFLMTSASNSFWTIITLLQKFQFPWRLLSVLVFTSAVLVAFLVNIIHASYKNLAIAILVISLLFFNKDYWHSKGYLQQKDQEFLSVQRTTTNDTGESSPIWSVRFMEQKPNARIEILSGEGTIKEIQRRATRHVYKVDARNRVRVRENTLYFPGWDVRVDGKPVNIEFQDPESRGLMTFYVEEGRHNVEVKFGETKLRLFADIISVAALGIITLLFFASKSWRSLSQVVLE